LAAYTQTARRRSCGDRVTDASSRFWGFGEGVLTLPVVAKPLGRYTAQDRAPDVIGHVVYDLIADTTFESLDRGLTDRTQRSRVDSRHQRMTR
jgi:hypothetical protein